MIIMQFESSSKIKTTLKIPLFESAVAAGFPSPAEDYVDKKLDLNEFLIQHPASTFFVRAKGHSMVEAGIFPGSLLVVDRSLEPRSGQVIIAVLNQEFTVKRYVKKSKSVFLMPENKDYKPIEIKENDEFLIWGVVTQVIHDPNS